MVTVPNSWDCLQVAYWEFLVFQTVLVQLGLFDLLAISLNL